MDPALCGRAHGSRWTFEQNSVSPSDHGGSSMVGSWIEASAEYRGRSAGLGNSWVVTGITGVRIPRWR